MNLNNLDQKAAESLAIKALAIVGLIALLIGVAWFGALAVRTAPATLAAISSAVQSAAVSLTSIFIPAEKNEVASPETPVENTDDSEAHTEADSGTQTDTVLTPGNETSSSFPINTGSGVVSDPNGRPDLAPKILAVGILDSENNFIEKEVIEINDRVAVKFSIENLGTKRSETWRFTAVLPTKVINFFDSPFQIPLNPGDRIEYTIAFDGIKDRGSEAVFTVNVDPGNTINETSEANNLAKRTIQVKRN